uniref:Uncharacterized protein n=1 Tax=Schistocephalus solidus TaxID=70667 RepID=A0A0X3Q2J0_SCHSO
MTFSSNKNSINHKFIGRHMQDEESSHVWYRQMLYVILTFLAPMPVVLTFSFHRSTVDIMRKGEVDSAQVSFKVKIFTCKAPLGSPRELLAYSTARDGRTVSHIECERLEEARQLANGNAYLLPNWVNSVSELAAVASGRMLDLFCMTFPIIKSFCVLKALQALKVLAWKVSTKWWDNLAFWAESHSATFLHNMVFCCIH